MFQINDKNSRNILVSCDHGILCINRFDYNQNKVGSGIGILDHGNLCTVEANECIQALVGIKNPVILDVGANIGAFTNWMSRYFPEGKIYCFEPQRLVFQILCANIAINNLYNVYAHNIAIGEVNSRIKILEPNYNIPNDFGTFSLIRNTISEKTVELIIDMNTLDYFAQQYEITSVDLIKIDAEGMDLAVLHGAKNLIEKYRPIIFVEFFDNYENNQEKLEHFLNENNYECKYVLNNILATPRKEI